MMSNFEANFDCITLEPRKKKTFYKNATTGKRDEENSISSDTFQTICNRTIKVLPTIYDYKVFTENQGTVKIPSFSKYLMKKHIAADQKKYDLRMKKLREMNNLVKKMTKQKKDAITSSGSKKNVSFEVKQSLKDHIVDEREFEKAKTMVKAAYPSYYTFLELYYVTCGGRYSEAKEKLDKFRNIIVSTSKEDKTYMSALDKTFKKYVDNYINDFIQKDIY